jgi:phosphoglycolate phosphatase
MTAQSLVFDLDGTISDPQVGVVRSINYALSAYDLEERSEVELVKFIGPPLDQTFEQLLGDVLENEDRRLVVSLVDKYRERYAEIGYTENVLYDGIIESLESLADRFTLVLCTSKRADFAGKILAQFDIDHLFQAVSGGDIGVTKTQQLAALLASGTIGPDAVVIGDRSVDLISAHSNRLDAIGVLWGFGDYQELSQAAPRMILEHPRQLIELNQ